MKNHFFFESNRQFGQPAGVGSQADAGSQFGAVARVRVQGMEALKRHIGQKK